MKLALKPIVERLRSAGFRETAGVLEWSRLTVAPRALPAAFVIPVGENARPNTTAGARDQAIDAEIAIILVLDGSRRDQDGVSEEVKTSTAAAIDALVGWTHPEAARPFDYVGGQLVAADGSTVAWRIRLTTRHHLRKSS